MRPTFIIDDHIPFIKGTFEHAADVHYIASSGITRQTLLDTKADAMIIRTRTRCNETLLDGTNIRLIATATIGTDHIDTVYCSQAGIGWTNAPGCNARSVAQYVGSALAVCAHEEGRSLSGCTLGIVGHGHVGTEVEKLAEAFGMNILLCDPIKANCGHGLYADIDTIATESDIITLHTPLTHDGDYPTYHLINSNTLNRMPRHPIIINTARGGVIDEKALIEALEHNIVSQAVIDCWENEPYIDRQLLDMAIIGTPHIAGYSADGKFKATCQVTRAVSDHFGITAKVKETLSPCQQTTATAGTLPLALLKNYPIYRDSAALKSSPLSFETLRDNYPVRRETDITGLQTQSNMERI